MPDSLTEAMFLNTTWRREHSAIGQMNRSGAFNCARAGILISILFSSLIAAAQPVVKISSLLSRFLLIFGITTGWETNF